MQGLKLGAMVAALLAAGLPDGTCGRERILKEAHQLTNEGRLDRFSAAAERLLRGGKYA